MANKKAYFVKMSVTVLMTQWQFVNQKRWYHMCPIRSTKHHVIEIK